MNPQEEAAARKLQIVAERENGQEPQPGENDTPTLAQLAHHVKRTAERHGVHPRHVLSHLAAACDALDVDRHRQPD